MYLMNIILLCCIIDFSYGLSSQIYKAYKQFHVKNKFSPVYEEKTIELENDDNLFRKLNGGFFAQIGSNPKHIVDEDYLWFDGDGMIHGVYFKNNKIHYQNKWIQTKRLQTENKWKKKMYVYVGELKGMQGLFEIFKYSMMELLGFIPQAPGTANTALLNWNKRLFALHEVDMPYELNVNFTDFNISTIKRIEGYKNIFSTTAHPAIDKKRNLIYLYGYNNYDFSNGKFIFNSFDKDLNLLYQKNISLINNGMIHDVGFTGNDMIIPDMPLKYDVNKMIQGNFPVYFDKKGKTRFGIFNVKKKEDPIWFNFNESFFIFHFARAYKKLNKYNIYACLMEDLIFDDYLKLDENSDDNNVGKQNTRLKKIILDTNNNSTKIIKNKYIENLNLTFSYNIDLPICSLINPNVIYCSIFDSKLAYIKGYIKINTKNFEKSKPQVVLFNKNTFGSSEPQPVIIDEKEYLLSFTNNDNESFISIIDIDNDILHNCKIPTRIPPGFHSIYYKA